ncbi:recombinase family protein [Bacillus sp. NTK071]|uniref:recombinase family protein n=1 Tax=Bacillus sp. NTK071 TaxID=2802175 RepID=UPI001A8CD3C8|nr:recombinase family protein [Bacillus sp. NTK071]MBN8207874.1 recombinase family protein [Bacillus sp. NTK071]
MKGRICHVAIYIRKSRGDSEKDLSNHRSELISICKDKNWDYDEFAEIGSGDSLYTRPKMIELLDLIQKNKYQAVLVFDYDRLGRGDLGDQDKVIKAFKTSNTKLITANPYKVYDLSNEQDEQYTDFHSFIARQEYKMIKKRLQQGKQIGAKMGRWTNGTPPFPYEYDKNTKSLTVNTVRLAVYRDIVEKFIRGDSIYNIANYLNEKGIKSPRGKNWLDSTIKRLLLDETHLGRIVYNKSRNNSSQKRGELLPRKQWIVKEDAHQAVKSQEEHDKIILRLERKKPARKLRYSLSSLFVCGVCKSPMYLNYKRNKLSLKPCQSLDTDGNKCPNRGSELTYFKKEILEQLILYINKLQQGNGEVNGQRVEIQNKLDRITQGLETYYSRLRKIHDSYEIGLYSVNDFLGRQNNTVLKMERLKEEKRVLEKMLESISKETLNEKIEKLNRRLDLMNKEVLTEQEENNVLKSLVERIEWKRLIGAEVEMTIHFSIKNL